MKKVQFIPLLCLSLLLLSACGNGEAEQLQTENDALRQRVAALEEENGRLSLENDLLGQDLAAAQDALEQLEAQGEENPIDPFYDELDTDGPTVIMAAVADSRARAWEAEARNVAGLLKDQLPLREDRDLVDAYLATVEDQLGRMDVMSIYPVSDVEISQEERTGTVGTLAHVLWPAGRAQIWKDTFYQLLGVLPGNQDYAFVFDPETARQELTEGITVTG